MGGVLCGGWCEWPTGEAAFLRAPLCPAGHLPHLGGDWQLGRPRSDLRGWRLAKAVAKSDLPLVGEMSGRTEGGAVPPAYRSLSAPPP
ncbi:MAG: hypothetical protein E5V67_34430, partial [Mesorhizobium sp.]